MKELIATPHTSGEAGGEKKKKERKRLIDSSSGHACEQHTEQQLKHEKPGAHTCIDFCHKMHNQRKDVLLFAVHLPKCREVHD